MTVGTRVRAAATPVGAATTRTARRMLGAGLVAAALATSTVACVRRPPVTTPTTTATTAMDHAHGDHGGSADAPYVSVDDPRLTPAQRQRARDLIARTKEAMRAFPDQASVVRAGYESI